MGRFNVSMILCLLGCTLRTLVVATPTVTIKLSRQHVPVVVRNRTVLYKTAYFSNLWVGQPAQKFTVVFDTGSGHTFLPSSTCADESCLLHTRYDRDLSTSAVDVNHNGMILTRHAPDTDRDQVSVQYGTGKITGAFAMEDVCLSPDEDPSIDTRAVKIGEVSPRCTRLRLIMASEMTSDPFKQFAFDGVVGLGLETLALDPDFHFLGNLMRTYPDMLPIFGVFLSMAENEAGEITFGGHDPRRVQGEFHWTPVVKPEQGYWRVGIEGVRVGNKTLSLCDDGRCSAIVDTGTSLLGVPKAGLKQMISETARRIHGVSNADELDCREVPGPPLIFDMGAFELVIEAAAYMRPAAIVNQTTASVSCTPLLLPVDLLDSMVFIFGEPLLQRYYTAFDAQKAQVAFARSVQL